MQRLVSCVILSCMILSVVFADEPFPWAKPNAVPPKWLERSVTLDSYYLTNPCEGAHRIRISAEISHEGAVALLEMDTNSCTLDEFGNASICTAVGTRSQHVELVQIPCNEIGPHARRSYALRRREDDDRMRLIVPPELNGDYRLLYRIDDGRQRVIPLRVSGQK